MSLNNPSNLVVDILAQHNSKPTFQHPHLAGTERGDAGVGVRVWQQAVWWGCARRCWRRPLTSLQIGGKPKRMMWTAVKVHNTSQETGPKS